jgi:two-component system chemotaxis sensor kinase CheA
MDEASDISGRGVGLDLVRELVKSANGTIAVATEKGRGTRFRISVPA